jgi:hypothetical protein
LAKPNISRTDIEKVIAAATFNHVTLLLGTIDVLGELVDRAEVIDVAWPEGEAGSVYLGQAIKFQVRGEASIEFKCDHRYNGSRFVFTHKFPLVVSGHFEDEVACIDSAVLEQEAPPEPKKGEKVLKTPRLRFIEPDKELN